MNHSPDEARALWQRIESIHAVTYFAPESISAAKSAGLRGFWMGYFGFRAAPLGAVGPDAVEALFANFEPGMVQRALPDAWGYASPSDLVRVRAAAAATALRRVVNDIDGTAIRVTPLLERAIGHADTIGRPLFAANRIADSFDDPVERLWQACTALREHRGDGHVAALAVAGLDGCQAHLVQSAAHGVAPEIFFDNRGWTGEQQAEAAHRLEDRGLLSGTTLTEAGQALRSGVENTTDELALVPFLRALDEAERHELNAWLDPVATAVQASDIIPFPNPMGLPRL